MGSAINVGAYEIQAYLDNKLKSDNTVVVASELKGQAYYAACRVSFGLMDVVYAVVMTSKTPHMLSTWYAIDEFEYPAPAQCPQHILDALSSTDDMTLAGITNPICHRNSEAWRDKCRLVAQREALNQLTANAIQNGLLQIREGR